MLKQYWAVVELYSMPNQYIPLIVPIDINSHLTPLIAVCYDEVKNENSYT